MILLWKAAVLEMGLQGLQAHPQKFCFAENLGKSPEGLGKNGAHVVWLQKVAPKFCLETHEGLFGSYTRERSSWPLWKKICWQKLHKKLFGQVWGNSGKILCTPKICLLLYLWWKVTSTPVALILKGQGGKTLAMPPFSDVSMHIILHALSLLVIVGCNVPPGP